MRKIRVLFILICTAVVCGSLIYPQVAASPVALANFHPEKEEYLEEQVVREVLSYVQQMREDDPLMNIEGIEVKTSNINGIYIDGQTYYYSLLPHMSFDPVARGDVGESEVNIVYQEDDSEVPVIIYTIKN